MSSDRRIQQQAGWVSRTFEGATIATTIPAPGSAAVRWVEVRRPSEMSAMGEKFLGSMLQSTFPGDWLYADGVDTEQAQTVYRVLVGKEAIAGWVDLPLMVMRGRFGYWPKPVDRVVCVIDHPDSVLAAGAHKRERITANTDTLKIMRAVVAGARNVLELMGADCVKCAEEHRVERDVVEMDRNGLGLCKRHSGFDVRPEGQKWQQERLL
jgi:hypothetical protein